MKICVTGHRPDKLYGYNLNDPRYKKLFKRFKELLIENNCTEAITGMALGADMLFALAVIKLKREGYNIKLHCAIPCRNHNENWNQDSKILYNHILKNADIVKLVSDEDYKPYLMQKRNEYMVDNADKVIAVWDGSKSGTYNCVKYAEKQNKEIIVINPNDIEVE